LILKPLLGLVFNSQKCCHTFVNWYNLLKLEVALWLFVSEDGVEPTNNAAERAIRPAVIWRRTSFGSDSLAGSEFVSRLLTVVSSLNLQERNILDFLAESILAARSGQIPPSLLP
jgi:hypothetical protein